MVLYDVIMYTRLLLHEVLLHAGSDVKVREISTLHDGHGLPE